MSPFFTIFLSLLITATLRAEAYDILDPNGRIIISWDILYFTKDGYQAEVNIRNQQLFRNFEHPGWRLSWEWEGREVIMQLEGATISQMGYCAPHITPQPVSCVKTPAVEDSNGGLLMSTFQDSTKTSTSFRILVGQAKKKGQLFSIPMNFSIMASELLYACGSPTLSKGNLHHTRASWKIICKYSPRAMPSHCSVSLSSFKRKTETNSVCSSQPQLSCPIQISWFIKKKRFDTSEVIVKVINHGMRTYANWNLYIRHGYVNNLTTVEGLNSKISGDVLLLWGSGILKPTVVGKIKFKAIMSHRPEHMPQGFAWIGDACSIPSADWIENLPDSTSELSLRKGIAYLFVAVSSTFVFSCVIKCICTPNLKLFSLRIGCRAQLLRESNTELSSLSFTELPE